MNLIPQGKSGQMIFVGIMTAIMVFIVLVQFISPLKDQITTARDIDNLNCTSTFNSVGTKASCVVIDWYLPYFLAAGIAVSVGFITQRKYVQT